MPSGVNEVSYDWVHEKWYFIDEPRHHIFVCDDPNSANSRLINGQGRCITLFKDVIQFPVSIAVDPIRGLYLLLHILVIVIDRVKIKLIVYNLIY